MNSGNQNFQIIKINRIIPDERIEVTSFSPKILILETFLEMFETKTYFGWLNFGIKSKKHSELLGFEPTNRRFYKRV